jgi:hypothetical protein
MQPFFASVEPVAERDVQFEQPYALRAVLDSAVDHTMAQSF